MDLHKMVEINSFMPKTAVNFHKMKKGLYVHPRTFQNTLKKHAGKNPVALSEQLLQAEEVNSN